MCVPKYMYVHHVPAGALGRKKTEADLLKLEMLAIVSCIVDAGNLSSAKSINTLHH